MKNLVVGTVLIGTGCAVGFVFGIVSVVGVLVSPKCSDDTRKSIFDTVYKTDPDKFDRIFVELMAENAKKKEVDENEEN